jgi:hypothetical protein
MGLPGFGFILAENGPTDEKFVGIAAVVLTGSGHARKMGIPTLLQKQAPWPVAAVVMSETSGIFEPETAGADRADWQYVMS